MPKKILVVDDEALILTTIERALGRVGYVTVKARNMTELSLVLETCAPFDLLISDVHLEDADVEDIISRVRGVSPSVPVLVISGGHNTLGHSHFIEKPFSLEDLRRKVGDMLCDPQ
ncbi:MAG: response regulator [Nitrospirae bacterium]|nr:response regulator [Nitrospirota bacterium]